MEEKISSIHPHMCGVFSALQTTSFSSAICIPDLKSNSKTSAE